MKTFITLATFGLTLAVLTAAEPPAAPPAAPAPANAVEAPSGSTDTKTKRLGRADVSDDIEAVVSDALRRAGDEVQKALEEAKAAGRISSESVREALAEARAELGRARNYAQNQAPPAIPAVPPVAAVAGQPANSSMGWASRSYSHLGGAPNCNLILVGKPLEPKVRADLEDDLDIMSRILDKKINREIGAESPDQALGIVITSAGMENRRMEAMYVDGFGVVFSAYIRMPLLPPEKPEDTKTKTTANSEWEDTKNALHGIHGKSGGMKRIHLNGMFGNDGLEYDAKKVEALEKSLVETLKNASNIRALEGDEHVSVAVTGGRMSSAVAFAIVGGDENSFEYTPSKSAASARPSTLHIRAKKADIDAFASDKLSYEEFRKKVSVNIY